jgi:hypothetical protein
MVSSPATAGPFMSNLQAKRRDKRMRDRKVRIMGEKERGDGSEMGGKHRGRL